MLASKLYLYKLVQLVKSTCLNGVGYVLSLFKKANQPVTAAFYKIYAEPHQAGMIHIANSNSTVNITLYDYVEIL